MNSLANWEKLFKTETTLNKNFCLPPQIKNDKNMPTLKLGCFEKNYVRYKYNPKLKCMAMRDITILT